MIGATTPGDKLLPQSAGAETLRCRDDLGSNAGKLEDARCVAYNGANLTTHLEAEENIRREGL